MGEGPVFKDDKVSGGMDNEKYKDIAPYKGEDFMVALSRLVASADKLQGFVSNLLGNDDPRKALLVDFISTSAQKIKCYDDFQRIITAGVLIPTIVKSTISEFSTSGTENLDPDLSYLFVSTHRDIVLDCALTDYALMLNGKPLCQMAFGDNLITSQFVGDLLRLNGGIIVKRDLPMREKYLESIRLSEYFVYTVTEDNTSVWIAQKSGRSKDGIDMTHPAIIKMLYLSQKGKGVAFSDLIKKLRIVPLAISYEYNPNDINMSREEVAISEKGSYSKKKYEDVVSMMKGIKGYKGRTHVAFGTPLSGNYEKPEEVACEIDRQIHLNYRLWDTNYYAYDYLQGSSAFKDRYEGFDGDTFISRLSHLSSSVRSFVLESYANPVRKFLEASC